MNIIISSQDLNGTNILLSYIVATVVRYVRLTDPGDSPQINKPYAPWAGELLTLMLLATLAHNNNILSNSKHSNQLSTHYVLIGSYF